MIRHEVANAASPVSITGLEQGAQYHVYAVVTDGPHATSKKVSPSVSAEAVAKA